MADEPDGARKLMKGDDGSFQFLVKRDGQWVADDEVDGAVRKVHSPEATEVREDGQWVEEPSRKVWDIPTTGRELYGSKLPDDLADMMESFNAHMDDLSRWDPRWLVAAYGYTEEEVMVALGKLHTAGVVRVRVDIGPDFYEAMQAAQVGVKVDLPPPMTDRSSDEPI